MLNTKNAVVGDSWDRAEGGLVVVGLLVHDTVVATGVFSLL